MAESFLSLLWLGFQNLGFRSVTELAELRTLGRDPRWWRLRLAVGSQYLFDTPYAIVQREGDATGRPHDELIWGETPCSTLDHMLSRVDAKPGQSFCDLGCGRGLTVLYAALCGLRAHGIDIVPTFIAKARHLSQSLGLTNVSWTQGSLLEGDLGDYDIAMLSWTTFPPDLRRDVTARLETLKPGGRVICLTYPVQSDAFRLIDKERLRFSWGWATAFYYQRSE